MQQRLPKVLFNHIAADPHPLGNLVRIEFVEPTQYEAIAASRRQFSHRLGEDSQPLSCDELPFHIDGFVHGLQLIGRLHCEASPKLLATLLVDNEITDDSIKIGARIGDRLVARIGETQARFLDDIIGSGRIAELAGRIRPQFAVIRIDKH